MTATKKRRPGAATPKRQKIQNSPKSSALILSLSRRAVNLAATAALVALLASIGALNIPGIVCTVLALNALCGLILKQEASTHENV